MSGVVLETLSRRKLLGLIGVLVVIQIVFFLIGGLIAPAPSTADVILATKCVDYSHSTHSNKWFYPRGEGRCESIADFDDEKVQRNHIEANMIVFAFQVPLPRDSINLDMSRWFQTLLSVLQIDISYDSKNSIGEGATLTLDARLGYRNIGDKDGDWKNMARSEETRPLDCTIDDDYKKDGYLYNCSLLPFFELGSCHHDFYLVNIRIPIHDNQDINEHIGKIRDIWMVLIHQNGGFTRVWFSIKTVCFPAIIIAMVWFWRRVMQLPRPTLLLERTTFALGISLTLLNLPIEWLTLSIDIPFMLLLSDIRQGIFYSTLLCFWVIFAGEHMMDQSERNRLVLYWKHLGAVVFGCICLFVFEMCERGVQLVNPFYSIWATNVGTNLALAFIILAGIAACTYFIFLCYMIVRVFRNISSKRSALPAMSKARQKYYSSLIYRFKVVMLTTLLCAALTVIFFIISQVSDGQWKWGEEHNLEYTSAFFTGVYGMWNIYVFALLCLYAPSHKFMGPITGEGIEGSTEEEVEFTRLPSSEQPTTSSIQTFVQKAALD